MKDYELYSAVCNALDKDKTDGTRLLYLVGDEVIVDSPPGTATALPEDQKYIGHAYSRAGEGGGIHLVDHNVDFHTLYRDVLWEWGIDRAREFSKRFWVVTYLPEGDFRVEE